MFFCVLSARFEVSWFHKRQEETKRSKEKRFDTCKFNNGSNCWITCIDIRLTCAPSTQHRHHSKNGMHLFIYFYWVSPEIFRANLFDFSPCGICWWVLKFSRLTDNHEWCITISHHWTAKFTNTELIIRHIEFATCFAIAKHTHNVMWTNKQATHSKLRHFSRDDNANVSRWRRKQRKSKRKQQ